jgi:hypothetical protein
MFETSQQEQSSQAPKVIIGAIVVVMALFGVLYFGHLNQEPAAAPAAAGTATPAADAAPAADADPMRDLQILKSNLGRDRQTQTMALWDVQVVNRSRTVAYQNIEYVTNYYDAQMNLLSTRGGTFPEPMAPMDQKTFAQVNDGLYPVGTASYTIGIKSAQGSQPQ